MHANLTLNLATLCGFLLVLARVSGLIALVPIPGLAAAPDAGRIALALALTVGLLPVWPHPDNTSLLSGRMLGSLMAEAGFGVTIGVAVAFLLEGIQLAAQVIGLQAGYSFASTIDPVTQADSTTLQILAQLFAGSLFFSFGFDHQVLLILARSLEKVPSGAYALTGPLVETVTRLGAGIFVTGLQLALPVLALTLLLEVAFAVLGRLHAQLQLLTLAFAAKMLVTLAFLASTLALFPGVFEKFGVAIFGALLKLVDH